MKKTLYRLMSLFCAVVILLSMPVTYAKGNSEPWASVYANTLNSAMLNCGVVSTPECGGFVDLTQGCPTGVIYADIVKFTNDAEPCLVLMYSDGNNECVSVDIYRYDKKKKTAKVITTIRKPYNIEKSRIAEIALAEGGDYRYIAYTEYEGDVAVVEDYYTIIKNNAFERVDAPNAKSLSGVLSFTDSYIHPEVDVSYYNEPLSVFFSTLKDYAASNVSYTDVYDDITREERDRLSRVLKRTAEFDYPFDIGEYSTMSEYSLAVNEHNGNGVFNAITNVYDLGDGLYYVRYSTDRCFYNGTILRRTDKVTDNYQLLCVRNDFIPFSDTELQNLKEAYLKNRLVLEKSAGGIELKNEPVIEVNKLNIEKKIDVPQLVSPSLRKPLALIGGGLCLALFIVLWIFMSSDDK